MLNGVSKDGVSFKIDQPLYNHLLSDNLVLENIKKFLSINKFIKVIQKEINLINDILILDITQYDFLSLFEFVQTKAQKSHFLNYLINAFDFKPYYGDENNRVANIYNFFYTVNYLLEKDNKKLGEMAKSIEESLVQTFGNKDNLKNFFKLLLP